MFLDEYWGERDGPNSRPEAFDQPDGTFGERAWLEKERGEWHFADRAWFCDRGGHGHTS